MTHPLTMEARKDKAEFAESIGITDAFISRLVDEFYQRVRADALLGPIFEKHISNWEPHLARMKDFWGSIAIESGRFKGNPMLKHVAIHGLGEAHFRHWLSLFNDTLADIAPNTKAAAFFAQKAEMVGQSLLAGIEAHKMRGNT